MIAALLLAASVPTAVDAENAFARDAQRIGQWTAFRKYADRDAVMFTPQAVWARDFLQDRKDPPKSVSWRPTRQLRLLRRPHRGEHRSMVQARGRPAAISRPCGSGPRGLALGL